MPSKHFDDTKMASMLAAIDQGKTLADAKASGLVVTKDDEALWSEAVADYETLKSLGYDLGGIGSSWL